MRSPLFTGVLVLAAASLGATANAQEVVKVAFIESFPDRSRKLAKAR